MYNGEKMKLIISLIASLGLLAPQSSHPECDPDSPDNPCNQTFTPPAAGDCPSGFVRDEACAAACLAAYNAAMERARQKACEAMADACTDYQTDVDTCYTALEDCLDNITADPTVDPDTYFEEYYQCWNDFDDCIEEAEEDFEAESSAIGNFLFWSNVRAGGAYLACMEDCCQEEN